MKKKELDLSTCHVEYEKDTLEIEHFCPVDNVYTYIYPTAEDINKLYLFLKDIVESQIYRKNS